MDCKVPVIADVGPYYDDGDVSATTPAERLGRFLIENYVPHGFAVAQVSVFGTGNSNHCMDLMGTDEQRGIDAAVSWLGEAEWSNGKVGLIGKSYDGSTPWQAATFGNPSLATIVPMSGLIGVHELMWRNGSMEARGAIMHNGVYGSFGVDGDAGTKHFVEFGSAEGRSDTFDELAYIASHTDLIAAFATDTVAAAKHYIEYGSTEGRTVTFDAGSYLAAHADLRAAFGNDLEAATRHYVEYNGSVW